MFDTNVMVVGMVRSFFYNNEFTTGRELGSGRVVIAVGKQWRW